MSTPTQPRSTQPPPTGPSHPTQIRNPTNPSANLAIKPRAPTIPSQPSSGPSNPNASANPNPNGNAIGNVYRPPQPQAVRSNSYTQTQQAPTQTKAQAQAQHEPTRGQAQDQYPIHHLQQQQQHVEQQQRQQQQQQQGQHGQRRNLTPAELADMQAMGRAVARRDGMGMAQGQGQTQPRGNLTGPRPSSPSSGQGGHGPTFSHIQTQAQGQAQLQSPGTVIGPDVLAALNRLAPGRAVPSVLANPNGNANVGSSSSNNGGTGQNQARSSPVQYMGQQGHQQQQMQQQHQAQQIRQVQPQQQLHQPQSTPSPIPMSQDVAGVFATMSKEQLIALHALASQLTNGGGAVGGTQVQQIQGVVDIGNGGGEVVNGQAQAEQQQQPTPIAPPQTQPPTSAQTPRSTAKNAIASGSGSKRSTRTSQAGPSSGAAAPASQREVRWEEEDVQMSIKKDDDEEYYDELSSNEGSDYTTPTSSKAASKTPQSQVSIDAGITAGCLKPYNESRQTCKSLDELIQYGDIELEPDYQREVVWPEVRQSGLIDSLFRGVYVPPVLFAVRTEQDGNEKRVCIDGKQRLTSISLFMQGQIPWIPTAGTHEGKKIWYTLPTKAARSNTELSQNLKKQFNMKLLTVAEFRDLPHEVERDIFQRVQLGMALSAAEKLRAMDTPYVRWIHALMGKHVSGDEGIIHYYANWERVRGRDFQNVALLCYMLEAYPNPRTHLAATSLKTFLKRADGVERSLRKRADSMFVIYIEILRDHQAAAIQTVPAKLSPIEFCFIPLIIHEFRKAPAAEIAKLIGTMRKYIRTVSKDVRSNTVITSALYAWLASQPKIRAKRDRGDDDESSSDDGGRSSRRQRRGGSQDGDADFVGDGITAQQMRTDRKMRNAA